MKINRVSETCTCAHTTENVQHCVRKETWLYIEAEEVSTEGAIMLVTYSKKDAVLYDL